MKRLRVAALGLWHESNTFSAREATIEDFTIERGVEIRDAHSGGSSTMAGFLDAAQIGVEVTPLVFAHVTPMGRVRDSAFESIWDEMRQALAQSEWDAVLLAQHGAAVGESHRDLDGELVRRIREEVGEQAVVGLALDMHANLSGAMLAHSSVTTLYRTNPHVDAAEQARRCFRMTIEAAVGKSTPVQALAKPPLSLNILAHGTADAPMSEVLAEARRAEMLPGMLSVDVAEGYPYADVPEMGMGVIAIADGDIELAEAVARDLARFIWDRREVPSELALSIRDALEAAARSTRSPVVLLDVGDNVGAGSPGDSVAILRVATELGVPIVQTVCDSVAVERCDQAGVGSRVELELGGKLDPLAGPSLTVSADVRLVADGHFWDEHRTHGGFRSFDGGRTAVVETDVGHRLVLTSRPVMGSTIQQFRAFGVEPATSDVVVAKGVFSPRPAFEAIAASFILVDSPGITTADQSRLEYRERRRPLYPLEPSSLFDDQLWSERSKP